MDAKDTQKATALVERVVADANEAQAYDHGYHDGWQKRDDLGKVPTEYTEGYKAGFAAAYESAFKDGLVTGINLQVRVVVPPAEPEKQQTTVVLPPHGSGELV